jgi:hypothetical protein
VTMKVNTHGYEGRKLTKTIVVHTNDPVHPMHELTISGDVEKFADILPKGMIRLAGIAGKPARQTITVTPTKKYPFTITGVSAQRTGNIKVTLTEQKPDAGGIIGYTVTVENIKKEAAKYFDGVAIRTTSKIKPLIVIRVYGDIKTEKEQTKK